MNFIGKILGVFIGWKIGGFFGAIAGLILGSIADKKLYELGAVNSSFFKRKTTRQDLFIMATKIYFSSLYAEFSAIGTHCRKMHGISWILFDKLH